MHLRECTEIVREQQICMDVSSNACSVMHGHPFFELVYVLSGTAEHTCDRKTSVVGAGDYFLINVQSMHGYRAVYGSADFKIINCMFTPRFIDSTLADARSFQDILNNYLLRFGYQKFSNSPTHTIYRDEDGRLRYLMTEMLNEYGRRAPGYLDVIRHDLLNSIIYLVRNEVKSDIFRTDHVTYYIKEYIARNYMREITLSDLSDELGFSLSNVSKAFKEGCHITFRDYLQKVRMEKACRLLRMTDKGNAEIAELVGYSDPAFFYRVFKRQFLCTPLEYRKRYGKYAIKTE